MFIFSGAQEFAFLISGHFINVVIQVAGWLETLV
jgi:hypothetical protein